MHLLRQSAAGSVRAKPFFSGIALHSHSNPRRTREEAATIIEDARTSMFSIAHTYYCSQSTEPSLTLQFSAPPGVHQYRSHGRVRLRKRPSEEASAFSDRYVDGLVGVEKVVRVTQPSGTVDYAALTTGGFCPLRSPSSSQAAARLAPVAAAAKLTMLPLSVVNCYAGEPRHVDPVAHYRFSLSSWERYRAEEQTQKYIAELESTAREEAMVKAERARAESFSMTRYYSLAESVEDFMDARGLSAWYGPLTRHLDIITIAQLQRTTAAGLRRAAKAAYMQLDDDGAEHVLDSITGRQGYKPTLSARKIEPPLHLDYSPKLLGDSDVLEIQAATMADDHKEARLAEARREEQFCLVRYYERDNDSVSARPVISPVELRMQYQFHRVAQRQSDTFVTTTSFDKDDRRSSLIRENRFVARQTPAVCLLLTQAYWLQAAAPRPRASKTS